MISAGSAGSAGGAGGASSAAPGVASQRPVVLASPAGRARPCRQVRYGFLMRTYRWACLQDCCEQTLQRSRWVNAGEMLRGRQAKAYGRRNGALNAARRNTVGVAAGSPQDQAIGRMNMDINSLEMQMRSRGCALN